MHLRKVFCNRNGRAISFALTVLILPFITLFFSQTNAWAGTTPASALIGKWGYTVLGHGTPDISGFFTWKTEAGTMEFTKNNMIVTYLESADHCPTPEFCVIGGESYTVPYTAISNLDGTITVIGNPGPDNGTMRIALSDDRKVAIMDGTTPEDNGQMFIIAVRIGERTYGNGDTNGDYYTIGYERDYQGADSGYYRSVTNLTTMNGDGTFSMTGVWNGDGDLLYITEPQQGTYAINPNGSMLVNGAATGYVTGDGKVAIFSNPGLAGGVKDDFMSNISLRKTDRTYSPDDVAGTWAITFFGDHGGQSFWSSFGIMTCGTDGTCEALLRVKHSDLGLINQYVQLPVNLTDDGSYGGFFLTGNIPHHSGAIGKDGNVMLVTVTRDWETDINNRRIGVAVRCTACADTSSPSLTVTTPLPKQKVLTTTITVEGTATDLNKGDNGIARITVKVNDGEPQVIEDATATGSDEVAWSREVSLIQGKNIITVEATDLDDNSTTHTITFACIADLTGPALKIKYPTRSIMSAYVELSGTAIDKAGSGVSQVFVNGVTMLENPVEAKTKASWSTIVPLSLGENEFVIRAIDGLGNSSEQTITVTRIPDTMAPVVKIISHRNNLHVSTATISLAGSATDVKKGNNGIARITVALNGGAEEDVDSGGSTEGADKASWTKAIISLSPGANTIVVKAYDTTGHNAGGSRTLTIYYDAP